MIERECNEGEKLLVKSICLKNYKAAAAAVTKIQPLMKKTVEQIGQKLKVELRNYSRDPNAVFKYDGDLQKLANYRSEHLIADAEQKLPILHTLICRSFSNVSEEKFAVNKKALAISGVLIPWIPSNKFTYRNNVILTTGGCKSEEIDYFHRLGLSSHKNTLRNIQERLSKNYDEDVKKWKETAMFDIKKVSFLKEVLSRQDQVNRANDMDVCTIDFTEANVASLPSYTCQVYEACLKLLPETVNRLYEDIDILQALEKLNKQPTPSFRYVEEYIEVANNVTYYFITSNICGALASEVASALIGRRKFVYSCSARLKSTRFQNTN